MNGKIRNFVTLCCCLAAVVFFLTSSLEARDLKRREMPRKTLQANKTTPVQGNLLVRVPGPARTHVKEPEGPLYREGEVLVIFKKGVEAQAINKMLSKNKLTKAKRFRVLSRIRGKEYALIRAKHMKAAKLLHLLSKSPLIEKVSFNYAKQLDQGCGGIIPDDSWFDSQWPLCNMGQDIFGYSGTPDADIDATEAWDIQTGSPDVVVAVLDTGVDYLHPDLDDNMWVNQAEDSGTPGVDDDGNGYMDDIYGIDTGEDDTDPMDIDGHGTHVAGTIAAEGDNSVGVAGINWNAKIMAVKGFRPDGYMYTDDELEALEYIIDMKQTGVNIVAINASYGCYDCFDQLEKDAIEAAGDEGIIFVAAAGNSATDNEIDPHYPSSYDSSNIIAVAATDMDDGLASFSNYGVTSVDLGAPGDWVFSTYFWYEYSPDLFFDDMEFGSSNWTSEGTWDVTTEQAFSPTHAWSDSPGANYQKNTSYALTSTSINLSGASGPLFLGFASQYELEEGFDHLDVYYRVQKTCSWERTTEKAHSGLYAWSDSPGGEYPNNSDNWLASPTVDISRAKRKTDVLFWLTGTTDWDYLNIYFSTDGGENWVYQGYVTGDYTDGWHQFYAPVPPDFRTTQFRVAFVLWSDGSITEDGYYIDDVEIRDSSIQFFFDNMESGDNGWAETVSVWDYQGYITGSSEDSWHTFNVPIDESYFWDQFRVRFVLWADYLYDYDGVYLDDIGIGPGEIVHGYAFMGGTSMAAPHVSGAVALMAAEYAGESLSDRIQRILLRVDPLDSLIGQVVTGGRLNLYNSLLDHCEGDFDGDGDVDGSDLAVFAADFGRTDCGTGDPCEGDFDGDGDVDGSDLAVFAADFGRTDCP